ncbi:hypothetical protein SEA_LEROY_57 [Gordonia phage Leroy]|nr:hypothetical protein SEA_LEROY_57 [Gordonia phage Leroy]
MSQSITPESKFEFVDDLPMGRSERANLIREFSEALRANPNRWAKYPIEIGAASTRGYATFINTGNGRGPKDLVAGDFEAKATRGTLYVRYVGGAA